VTLEVVTVFIVNALNNILIYNLNSMSLRALLEIVVHLETFRNIDLFFQGLYYVKVSLSNKKGDEVRLSISHKTKL
jgi:hypothetical protein